MSQNWFQTTPRPCRDSPAPRAMAISFPSRLQLGWMYSPACRVRRSGVPPPARTFHRWPLTVSSQLVNAIKAPSGDQAGAYSKGAKPSGVRRRGVPLGRSITHTRPTAWKASRRPSGEALCQRVNFTASASSLCFVWVLASSEMVRCTLAEKGIVVTTPLDTSRRRSFPPCVSTMVRPSALHA